jgi:hypothetical protein
LPFCTIHKKVATFHTASSRDRLHQQEFAVHEDLNLQYQEFRGLLPSFGQNWQWPKYLQAVLLYLLTIGRFSFWSQRFCTGVSRVRDMKFFLYIRGSGT